MEELESENEHLSQEHLMLLKKQEQMANTSKKGEGDQSTADDS